LKNIEIFIPSWPGNPDTVRKLGAADYGPSVCSVDSFKIAFRARQVSEGYLPEYQYRCWMDIGMTFFVYKHGQVSIDVGCQDVHSADIGQLEHLIKCLKWAEKRLGILRDKTPTLDSLPFYLLNLCTVLGIHRTIQYHGSGVPDTYAPVSEVLEVIVAECKRRWERLQ
jgi:hypothetical protein